MKLNEIISLNSYFKPYYDLENEQGDYWKQFISNEQFENLMELVFKTLYSEKSHERNSIWLHGTYGTGKSHASGVIKKLISEDWSEISDYVLERIKKESLKADIKKLTQSRRAFPVILKGLNNISSPFDFAITIEEAVRKSLETQGIKLSLKTDFEKYIIRIENEKSNFWDMLIKESYELREEDNIKTPADLIKQLVVGNIDVLKDLRNALESKDQVIATVSITEWLKEVISELKAKNLSDRLVIFWDEFTSIMGLHNQTIWDQIQDIAELTNDYGISLFLISHVTQQHSFSDQERKHTKKVEGRFETFNYEMQLITTYHLLSNAVKKDDKELWEKLKDNKAQILSQVIDKISIFTDHDIRENIQNLFPIHPYSAYIANYIAREIGSTERSVFKFLYDEEKGFMHFINHCDSKDEVFCTADYIFRFFEDDFRKKDSEYLRTILDRYSYNYQPVKKESSQYAPLFEGLMLLNISHHLLNTSTDSHSLLIPNEENISLMFMGTKFESIIPGFLQFIHDKRIIEKDFENRFIVETSSLDSRAVSTHKDKIRGKYTKIESIVDLKNQEMLFRSWRTTRFRRQDTCDIKFSDANLHEHEISQKARLFKNNDNYSMNVLVFASMDYQSLDDFGVKVKKLKDGLNPSLRNTLIVQIQNKIFTTNELDRFIDYTAKAEVAQTRRQSEEEERYKKNANALVSNWVSEVERESTVEWFLYDDTNNLKSGKEKFSDFSTCLNQKITPLIFHKSFDILFPRLDNYVIWKTQMSVTMAEHYLSSIDLAELESRTSDTNSKRTREMFLTKSGNSIIKQNLRFIRDEPNHPLCQMQDKLSLRFKKGEEINLIDAFEPLFKPPFGFYKSQLFLATAGYLLRKYRDKLQKVDTGHICDTMQLREMIEKVFKFYCDGKSNVRNDLIVRLGTEEEKELVDLLSNIFNLQNCQSITDTKYKIDDWLKQNHNFPLWLYNFDNGLDGSIKDAFYAIDKELLSYSTESNPFTIKKIQQILEVIQPVQLLVQNRINSYDEDYQKSLFSNFFQDVLNSNYKIDEFDNLYQYVLQKMQEDNFRVAESLVRSWVEKWDYEKLKQKVLKNPKPDNEENNTDKEPVILTKSQKTELIERINKFSGNYSELFKNLITQRPDICSDLLDILDKLEKK
ncbi:MAG: hypothetical protein JW870_20810 [Candidatus Delongbacteria bacterium]|nr:hypothetical protein [Candidatus Delongbacteria bacterium]